MKTDRNDLWTMSQRTTSAMQIETDFADRGSQFKISSIPGVRSTSKESCKSTPDTSIVKPKGCKVENGQKFENNAAAGSLETHHVHYKQKGTSNYFTISEDSSRREINFDLPKRDDPQTSKKKNSQPWKDSQLLIRFSSKLTFLSMFLFALVSLSSTAGTRMGRRPDSNHQLTSSHVNKPNIDPTNTGLLRRPAEQEDDDDDGGGRNWEKEWERIDDIKQWESLFRVERKKKRYVEPKDFQFVNPKPADLQVECVPLRSKRYFSDGFCTSLRPVNDHVCIGSCLPIGDLPWYAEYIKVWSRTKTHEYRCVNDVVVRRKIPFACHNGETRTYVIPVVQSCKCKRYDRNQNRSPGTHSTKNRLQPIKNPKNRDRKRNQNKLNVTANSNVTVNDFHEETRNSTQPHLFNASSKLDDVTENRETVEENYQLDDDMAQDDHNETDLELLESAEVTNEPEQHEHHEQEEEEEEDEVVPASTYPLLSLFPPFNDS